MGGVSKTISFLRTLNCLFQDNFVDPSLHWTELQNRRPPGGEQHFVGRCLKFPLVNAFLRFLSIPVPKWGDRLRIKRENVRCGLRGRQETSTGIDTTRTPGVRDVACCYNTSSEITWANFIYRTSVLLKMVVFVATAFAQFENVPPGCYRTSASSCRGRWWGDDFLRAYPLITSPSGAPGNQLPRRRRRFQRSVFGFTWGLRK